MCYIYFKRQLIAAATQRFSPVWPKALKPFPEITSKHNPYLCKDMNSLMNKAILFFILLSFHLAALAQQRITGTITDSKDKSPLPTVNVLLMQAGDTTKFTGAQTDLDGKFEFSNVQPGNYKIKTVYLGYSAAYKPVTVT